MKARFRHLLLLVLLLSATLAQAARVTGVVSGDDGQPVPGVNVVAKGTNVGAITGADGRYSISLPDGATTLVFSSLEYATQEREISGEEMDVTVAKGAQSLDEVVVVAYGISTKASFTGSAASVSSADMKVKPITNVTTAIAGAAPGIQSTMASGQPGSEATIRIRGFSSINSSNDPLYVVDGVPYSGSISSLSTDDIENVTILKDAASSSLYGSRAANGVVMITTKKGRSDHARVNFKMTQGVVSRGLQEYDRVSAEQYYPLEWEAYRNNLLYPAAGGTSAYTLETASQKASQDIKALLGYNPFGVPNNQIVLPDGTLNPSAKLAYPGDLDWEKAIQRTGYRQSYTLSADGATEKGDYFLSMGYTGEQGYVIRSDFERYNVRANVNLKPKKWFKTGVNVGASRSTGNSLATASTENAAYTNPFNFARYMGPIYPVYEHNMVDGSYVLDAQGEKIYDFGAGYTYDNQGVNTRQAARPGGASPGRHIVAEMEWNEDSYIRNAVNSRGYMDFFFLKDFKFTLNIGADMSDYLRSQYANTEVGDGAPGGRGFRTNSMTAGITVNQLLNYKKTLLDVHNFDVLLGHENFDYTYKYLYAFKSGVVAPGNSELINFASTSDLYSYTNTYKTEGYFARLNYDYNGKYILSGSFRRDGSSRFYKDNRWGNFWSVGASWLATNEEFFKPITWLNSLKVRSSYGSVGNDGTLYDSGNPNYYPWQDLYTIFPNGNAAGYYYSSVENKNLQWESNATFDVGVEFAVLDNRLHGAVEFYHRTSDNLLFKVQQPLSVSPIEVWENIGAMYNQGVEASVGGDIIRTKEVRWSAEVNFTTLKNKVTKLPNGNPIVSSTKRYAEGESMYQYWLRSYVGVDPTDGAALYKADTKLANINNPQHDVRVINGDTLTTVSSRALLEYQGSAIPDLFGSFSTSVSYKGLTLSVQCNYAIGGKVYDANYAQLMSVGSYGAALHRDVLDSWHAAGNTGSIPRLDSRRNSDFNAASNRWLTSGSYLQLANVSLSYDLPRRWMQAVDLEALQVFASGENLAFLSARKGMNSAQAFSGVTSNGYIPSRVFTVGLNLTF